jgi:hypothetical protein
MSVSRRTKWHICCTRLLILCLVDLLNGGISKVLVAPFLNLTFVLCHQLILLLIIHAAYTGDFQISLSYGPFAQIWLTLLCHSLFDALRGPQT